MYAMVSKAGAFLYATKSEAIKAAQSNSGHPEESLYGWLFWTPATLDLLLKMECRVIMCKSQKEVSASTFVEAYKKTEMEFIELQRPVFT